MPYQTKPAFRCLRCSHLEGAEAAGESSVPNCCSCCGAGVTFDTRGNKTVVPDTWEVLEKVVPLTPDQSREQDALRIQQNLAIHDAFEKDWKANQLKYLAEYKKLLTQHKELKARYSQVADSNNVAELEQVINAKVRVEQAMKALEDKEPTPRHAAHKAKLLEGLENHKLRTVAKPKSVFAYASDGAEAESTGTATK